MRALAILKQCSAQASETATEDQASDHSHQNKMQRSEFELDVQEAPPTADQVSNVREYLDKEYKDNKKALERIKRDISSPDAVQKFKQDPDSFPRPVVRHVARPIVPEPAVHTIANPVNHLKTPIPVHILALEQD